MPYTAVVNHVKKHYVECIICLLLLFFVIPIRIGPNDEVEKHFQKYLKNFNKSYEDSAIYQQKLQAFKNSLKNIEILNLNQTNKSAEYGLTKFSDMLPEEFLQITLSNLTTELKRILLLPDELNSEQESLEKIRQSITKFNIPQKVDWREKNVVTNAVSQQLCSACWAFSGIGVIESLNAIKTGKLQRLSIQQMIDCAKYNDGCDGGNVCSMLSWMKTNQIEVATEKKYPLILSKGECKNVTSTGIQIKDYECTNLVGSEEVILALLAKNGPVAVAINALSWQNYVGGVIQFHCDGSPLKLNHAVEIVGYDLASEVPYYIIKNSWGEDFGDNGYLYLAIGKNICGLAHEVAVVTMV